MIGRTIKDRDLFDNPTARIPVAIVLDCSPSMSGEVSWGAPVQQTNPSPIEELNAGVALFYRDVCADDISASSAEMAVIAYADTPEVVRPFQPADDRDIPQLQVMGSGTDIGSAVREALRLLDDRKREYKEAGLDYYQPWLVLMTDGQPTHGPTMEAAEEVRKRVSDRKLVTFPVGIGTGADMAILQMFMGDGRSPFRLDGLNFKPFFKWLSASISNTGASTPGEDLTVPDWPEPDVPW